MNKFSVIILFVIGLVAVGAILVSNKSKTTSYSQSPVTVTQKNLLPMIISSPAFAQGQAIPKKYSCDDLGVNPPLEFKDVPPETNTLAFILDDPDAPNGAWTHWLLWNIDPKTSNLAENSAPDGAVQGQASSGQNVYGGPCPPAGTHHYHFKLFALDAKLSIPSFSDVAALKQAMNGHIISQAELIGTYSK